MGGSQWEIAKLTMLYFQLLDLTLQLHSLLLYIQCLAERGSFFCFLLRARFDFGNLMFWIRDFSLDIMRLRSWLGRSLALPNFVINNMLEPRHIVSYSCLSLAEEPCIPSFDPLICENLRHLRIKTTLLSPPENLSRRHG